MPRPTSRSAVKSPGKSRQKGEGRSSRDSHSGTSLKQHEGERSGPELQSDLKLDRGFNKSAFLQHASALGVKSDGSSAADHLQRDYGNRYVHRLADHLQRAPKGIQRKPVNVNDDRALEREADQMGSQAVTAPVPPAPVAQTVQKKDAGSRKVGKEGGDASWSIEHSVSEAKGGGDRLPPGVRARMEGAFGADFSGVKVHNDAQADKLNRSMGARAFTTGNDIFFGKGEFNPGTAAGKETLAHELTHVVQQGGAEKKGGAGHGGDGGGDSKGSVQRKLKGTSQVMKDVGTSGKNWNDIRKSMSSYEAVETRQASAMNDIIAQKAEFEAIKKTGGSVDPSRVQALGGQKMALNEIFGDMRRDLQEIIDMSQDWIAKHSKDKSKYTVKQLQTLQMMMPRLKRELADLDQNKFMESVGFNDSKLKETIERAVGGQVNELDYVKYEDFEGYFKEEIPEDPMLYSQHGSELGRAGDSLGVDIKDPNLGPARSQ